MEIGYYVHFSCLFVAFVNNSRTAGNRALGTVLGCYGNGGKQRFGNYSLACFGCFDFEIIFQKFEQRSRVAAVFGSLINFIYVEILSVLSVRAFIAFNFADKNVIFRVGILDKQVSFFNYDVFDASTVLPVLSVRPVYTVFPVFAFIPFVAFISFDAAYGVKRVAVGVSDVQHAVFYLEFRNASTCVALIAFVALIAYNFAHPHFFAVAEIGVQFAVFYVQFENVYAVFAVCAVLSVGAVKAVLSVGSVLSVFAFNHSDVNVFIAVGVFDIQRAVFYFDVGDSSAVLPVYAVGTVFTVRAVFAFFSFKRSQPLLERTGKACVFDSQLIRRLAVRALFSL